MRLECLLDMGRITCKHKTSMSYFRNPIMPSTVKDRLKASVRSSSKRVFLRKDFDHLGEYRQVSRALEKLHAEEFLLRAGYGVYLLPASESPVDLEGTVRAVRSRLGQRVRRHVIINGATVVVGEKVHQYPNAQDRLDTRKLQTAKLILQNFSMTEIRNKSIENIRRWNANGVWVSAHDEWSCLMSEGSDEQVIAAMTGDDERANRLRQSPPYCGLLKMGPGWT